MWGPRVAYRPRRDGSFTIGNGYRGLGADYDLTLDSLRNLQHFLPAYQNNWRLLKLSLGHEFIQRLRASLSAAARARPLPEPRVNTAKVARNVKQFRALFPHLSGIGLARSWAGRIDLTPDVIPIIDRPDPDNGLYVAAGFSGHGFALGPSHRQATCRVDRRRTHFARPKTLPPFAFRGRRRQSRQAGAVNDRR